MVTTVRIRNVPGEFHRRLKALAAAEGVSIPDCVLREVGKALDRPTRTEVLARLRAQPVRRLAHEARMIAMSPAERGAVARAEERRARWSGGRASFADAAAQDVVFWQQVPGGERLGAVFALAMEWYGPAPAEPSAGLRRSAGGIRQR